MSEPSLVPSDYIPHRPPFLLVDEMVSIDPGLSAVGKWTLKGDEYFFPGHFPGRPTLPGVLLVEALAQCAGVSVMADPQYQGRLALFGGIQNAKFRRQVMPGDTVLLEVTMNQVTSRGGKATGRATVEGKVAAEADMFFVFVSAE
jgi:3-hydroxyacyl-[acyl-carrier-protein] dehydratase